MNITAREVPRSYWRKVAEKNGINREVFNLRITRGWELKRAATQPLRKVSKQDGSGASLCREAGLPIDSVCRYRRRHPERTEGMADAEVVELIIKLRSTPSINALAKRSGINPATVWSRIHKGMSVKQALTEPVQPLGSTIHQNRRRA